MRLIEGLDALEGLDLEALYGDSLESHSVVSVGVFDAVHLGHQRLLHELLEMASELNGVPTVITFANHPDQLLKGVAPPLLVSVPHRLRLLRRAGVQRLVLLDFAPRIREITATDFAQNILHKNLRAKGLLLGFDSALGKNREGTPTRFAELGKPLGFVVREGQPFTVDDLPVSSTAIRTAITTGDLPLAQRYLGRWPSTFGKVVHGDSRGNTIGFPTANVLTETPVLPPCGVYAVEVLLEGEVHSGVANLGVHPTFTERPAPVLEVHLLDYQGDLYDTSLEVCFLSWLRPEQRFESVDQLRDQITQDIRKAREVFAS